MTKQKSGGLGRGLGSILPDINLESVKPVVDTISTVPVDKVTANPFQPRKEFDEETLEELAQSIRQQGVITPITVRRMPDGTYQLIAGERRWRASQRAGLKEIPAYVRAASDNQMMEMALVENIQRENLNAMEVALAYRSLIEECRLTHEELSEKMGKNRSTITNYLRLLRLPDEIQKALKLGKISVGHAKVLLGVESPAQQRKLFENTVRSDWSVRQLEQKVKALDRQAAAPAAEEEDLPELFYSLAERIGRHFAGQVAVRRSPKGGGTITIRYDNDEQVENLLKDLERQ